MRRFVVLMVGGFALIAVACAGAEDRQLPPWPSEYTMRAVGDIEIQFAYPDGTTDFIASVFIRHEPSGSSVGVNQAGLVSYADINGSEGAAAICAVLSDEALMEEVKSRAVELNTYTFGQGRLEHGPCGDQTTPAPAETPAPLTPQELREFFDQNQFDSESWPRGYSRPVTDEIEIRYTYPALALDWAAPIIIRHIPSSETISTDLDGRVIHYNFDAAPTINSVLCSIIADKSLMDEVTAKAAEIDAYWFRTGPVTPDPCQSQLSPIPTETPVPLTREEVAELSRQVNKDREWAISHARDMVGYEPTGSAETARKA